MLGKMKQYLPDKYQKLVMLSDSEFLKFEKEKVFLHFNFFFILLLLLIGLALKNVDILPSGYFSVKINQ